MSEKFSSVTINSTQTNKQTNKIYSNMVEWSVKRVSKNNCISSIVYFYNRFVFIILQSIVFHNQANTIKTKS